MSAFPATALVREHLGEGCVGVAAAVSAVHATLFAVTLDDGERVEISPVAAYRDDTVLPW